MSEKRMYLWVRCLALRQRRHGETVQLVVALHPITARVGVMSARGWV